jgi:hypothetical protein
MHFSPPLLGFDSEDWPVIFGKPEMITSDTLCLTVLCEVCERKTAIFRPSNVPL